ncbi:MAG: hypothetical protein IPL46_28515 [Saprospiraceae bacterium]|nr:hypothetical protein [Saprospiraceae bacterium]
MTKLHLIARFKIHTGQIEAFKKLSDQCTAIVNEKEKGKGNLLYEWFLNEQISEGVAVETYADSGALLTHMGNVGAALGEIMQISDFSGELFGNPSTQLQEAASGLPITVFLFWEECDKIAKLFQYESMVAEIIYLLSYFDKSMLKVKMKSLSGSCVFIVGGF